MFLLQLSIWEIWCKIDFGVTINDKNIPEGHGDLLFIHYDWL
jgi:hypothetical protein